MELSLLEMAERIVAAELAIRGNVGIALEGIGQVVEATAKAEIGTYQEAIGPFPAWAELAEFTKKDRVEKGYTPNDPLLRSGEMRDGIGHTVDGLEVAIGSDSEKMVYHEFGTSRMPPRPVLGPAAEHHRDRIVNELGAAVIAGIIGSGLYRPPAIEDGGGA